jgi:ATP-dependent protease ClpP protease subunit
MARGQPHSSPLPSPPPPPPPPPPLLLRMCIERRGRGRLTATCGVQDGKKLAYDTEAFAIYDTMKYVKPPIHTLCVGNAWGEAALLLSSGAKVRASTVQLSSPQPCARPACVGSARDQPLTLHSLGEVVRGRCALDQGFRASLPSATIMLKQPIQSFRGQASDIEIQRQEIRQTKLQMVRLRVLCLRDDAHHGSACPCGHAWRPCQYSGPNVLERAYALSERCASMQIVESALSSEGGLRDSWVVCCPSLLRHQNRSISCHSQWVRVTRATDRAVHTRKQMEILAANTGHEIQKIEKDINRPYYLAPHDAVEYGLIDKVLEKTRND